MTKIVFNDFSKGLFIEGAQENMPAATARQLQGVHRTIIPGELRSRNGSTLVTAKDSHSLVRFNDTRFQAETTAFYQAGTSKRTGLDGTRLSFAVMAPTLAVADYLFCAGGGDLFKMDASGTASNWGIAIPGSAPTDATGAAGVLTGTYLYAITFVNSTSGTESNAGATSGGASPTSEKIDLSAIPTSADAQVDQRNIYRTVAGGADGAFFLVASLADNTTTIYTDNIADASLGAAIKTDNDPPLDTYEDCYGPHGGRMWWCGNTVAGAKGRVYYSPLGRAEAVEGFLDITNDDDPTVKIIAWNGNLYVFTQSEVYEILGSGADGIFSIRKVAGSPGTQQVHSVATCDKGIFYVAKDGIRIFNGTRSELVGYEALARLLQGETATGFTSAFAGVSATFGNNEYVVSDGTNTIAYEIDHQRWRSLGIGCSALYYEMETRTLRAGFGSEDRLLENEGTTTDNGTGISWAVETPSVTTGAEIEGIIKRVIVDINAGGQTITPVLTIDNITDSGIITTTAHTLPIITNANRAPVEFPIVKPAVRAFLTLTGTLTAQVILYAIIIDAHIPESALESGAA
jgi:hypothetical protein